MNMVPTRPVLRWHGGKWLLAPWIIQHFPAHRIYVEPFGGAASVLLRKWRSYAEVYNDLDDDVVSLFRVLREPSSAALLVDKLRLTPYARQEFHLTYEHCDEPIERARRLVARSFMGFGSNAPTSTTNAGFRAMAKMTSQSPGGDWRSVADALPAAVDRLRGVVIENRPAMDVMAQHDSDGTLHYVDPPYLPETRAASMVRADGSLRGYRHELSTEDHRALLACLTKLKGMVVLSGYPSALYDDALPGWRRVERRALADGARERVEVLWLNPAACAAASQPSLLVAT